MSNKLVLTILIAITILASGCASNSELNAKTNSSIDIDNSGLNHNEDIRKYVIEEDNVTCYIYDQHNGYAGMGGLSCIKGDNE